MQVEIGNILGMDAAMTLWDMEKFYDTLDLIDCIGVCRNMDYPKLVLALAAQAHAGPARQVQPL